MGPSASVTQHTSTVPDAPVLSINGHSANTIALLWTGPDDEGSPITGYDIFRSVDNVNFSKVANNVQAQSFTDDATDLLGQPLTTGTTYYYYVQAKNNNGSSQASNVVSEYPSQSPQSAVVASVVASNTSSTGRQLQVSFSAPVNNGGSPSTDGKIKYGG